MSASTAGSRRSYLGPPPGDPVERALKGASDLVAVQVWRAVAPLCVRLGEPRAQIGHAEWSALLVWPASGGWIEVGADEVHWFLVDPGGVMLPEEGHTGRANAAAAVREVAERWGLAAPEAPSPIGWDAFLDLATRSRHRLEYVQGYVYAMAGGTPEHSYVGGNVLAVCKAGLRKGPCKAFNPDLYIQSVDADDPKGTRRRLPDVTIVCGPIQRDPQDNNVVTNPTVLFEILSPSNRAKDTKTNVVEYRRIPTLQHYVVVDITTRTVHVHSRTQNGWDDVLASSGTVELPAVTLSLPLTDIFEGVDDL